MSLMDMKRFMIVVFLILSLGAIDLKADIMPCDTIDVAYRLHGQTRRFRFVFEPAKDGGLTLHWSIMRNLKLWTGTYTMPASAVNEGSAQSWLMPEDGKHITLGTYETFAIISKKALAELNEGGKFTYNGVLWMKETQLSTPLGDAIVAKDLEEGAVMTILDNPALPLIVSMSDNPLEIDWTAYCHESGR